MRIVPLRASKPILKTLFTEFQMNLFAVSSEGPPYGLLLFFLVWFLGTRKLIKVIRTNPAAGGMAKKGAMNLIGRLFK